VKSKYEKTTLRLVSKGGKESGKGMGEGYFSAGFDKVVKKFVGPKNFIEFILFNRTSNYCD